MAFFGWTPSKTDVARVATDGERSLHFPAYSPSLTKVKVLEGACASCSKETTHNVCKLLGVAIPQGESRFERLPAANKLSVADINKLQTALAIMRHAGHGMIGNDVVYNAGSGGDNATQTETYEITAVSGNTLTLLGANPKRLQMNEAVLNPNWPMLAPDSYRPPGLTDTEWDDSPGNTPAGTPPFFDGMGWAQYISTPRAYAMPVGASVEYQSPSALSGKNNPVITKIYPPASDSLTGVTFDVDVSIDADSAMEPIDANDPPSPDKYYCKVRMELLFPCRWLHVTAPVEVAFTRREAVEFTTDAIHDLLDTDGDPTRVLWPGMIPDAITIQLFNGATAGPMVNALDVYSSAPRLVTTDSGATSWSTKLDLRGLGIGTTYTKAVVTFHPEALTGDTWRMQFAGGCAHSYQEHSGSYEHDSGYRCAQVESTGFADYQGAQCWKPGSCSRFALGDAVEYFGTAGFLPDDGASLDFWCGVWNRSDWLLRQLVAGVSSPAASAFRLEHRATSGPSILTLLGHFVQSVPVQTKVATVAPWLAPVWGQRVTWDDSGDAGQAVAFGAFLMSGNDYSGVGGDDLRQDVTSTARLGSLASEVTGWQTKTDPLGTSLPSRLAALAFKQTGGTNPYTYTFGGAGFGRANNRWTDADMAITSVDLTEIGDPVTAAFVRARFPA